jgi:hypothetical protein
LIRRYIADAATQEWPMMAKRTATLRAIPAVLAEALQASLVLNPSSEGQKTAQREITTALETALDARRQRIIISQSQVNLLKWSCLFMQAVCALVAIALVHSDNRLASIIAMGIFATGVAASRAHAAQRGPIARTFNPFGERHKKGRSGYAFGTAERPP